MPTFSATFCFCHRVLLFHLRISQNAQQNCVRRLFDEYSKLVSLLLPLVMCQSPHMYLKSLNHFLKLFRQMSCYNIRRIRIEFAGTFDWLSPYRIYEHTFQIRSEHDSIRRSLGFIYASRTCRVYNSHHVVWITTNFITWFQILPAVCTS